jgi:hypothetical protein
MSGNEQRIDEIEPPSVTPPGRPVPPVGPLKPLAPKPTHPPMPWQIASVQPVAASSSGDSGPTHRLDDAASVRADRFDPHAPPR